MKSREQREEDKRRWQAKCEDMYDELRVMIPAGTGVQVPNRRLRPQSIRQWERGGSAKSTMG